MGRNDKRHGGIGAPGVIAAAGLPACFGARATVFDLHYSGRFGTTEALNLQTDANPASSGEAMPFSLVARFDDTNPTLAPPSPPAPREGTSRWTTPTSACRASRCSTRTASCRAATRWASSSTRLARRRRR